MNRITISTSDFKMETTSTWLASVLQFALDIDFFRTITSFQAKDEKSTLLCLPETDYNFSFYHHGLQIDQRYKRSIRP